MLYITSGRLKGLPLQRPSEKIVRPTSSKLREAVMSILQTELEGAVFVDMFAGSGSVGLEAVSRGASRLYCFEGTRGVYSILLKNVAAAKARLQKGEVDLAEISCHQKDILKDKPPQISPDIIWMDPPYHMVTNSFDDMIRFVEGMDIGGGCTLILEAPRQFEPPEMSHWETRKSKRYGDTALLIWERSDS